ncbi:DNA ligase D [Acuticoccus mangrovi]|uniref:DNA ligase (ATP) n=1 Tax=Acuticoccus mangrovi TaxID=2796142 RepID=A0A934IRQ5_9HYPH|nr:DNA ligase D [Acuticoccus mangrovi]
MSGVDVSRVDVSGLDRYRSKRDFDRTSEPRPKRGRRSAGLPRFVVQKHDASRLHYDFRLEHDGVLKSWAVTRGPSLDPADKRLAVETEDHPLDYAGFEGTIPADAYGGGTVMVWDEGTWEMADGKDAADGLAAGSLSFVLHGERLKGRWHLERMKPEKGRPPQWLLIKVDDEEARRTGRAVTERFTRSVVTRRTLAEIARSADPDPDAGKDRKNGAPDQAGKDRRRNAERPAERAAKSSPAVPRFVAPALCRSRKSVPRGKGWLAEVKYDGYRMILRAAEGRVALLTRTGKDWTDRFPAIADEAGRLAERGVMLDGEVVVFDDAGRSDFGALQRSLRDGADGAVYVAFDALFVDGEDLREEPIETRKQRLTALVEGLGRIRYGDHVADKQEALFAHAEALGLEGIIAKKAGSPYRSGRHDGWVKVRAVREAPFVVGAYTVGENGGLGALVVGAHAGDRLVPCGRVGTGFSASDAKRLLAALRERATRRSPFAQKLTGRGNRFVRPDLVVDVAYLAMTDEGMLRHAVFVGESGVPAQEVSLPSDHPATETDRVAASPARRSAGRPDGAANKETPMATTVFDVPLSHPDKVLYPEQNVTKAALAAHYERHMALLLPHVAGRPLTLVRCPQGRAKACFYQRHPEGLPERMARDIGEDDGLAIVAEEPADIIELVQRGVLEIHVRGARVDRPERPDRLVFDLDPGEGVAFAAVRDAAFVLRERLADMDLAAFVKTTGGKGLHVMVPIERRVEWAEAKAWTRWVAAGLAGDFPDRYLINMSKAKRKGRIFIDYLRNDLKASAVAPYSTRAREGAPFAGPLTWEALEKLETPAPFHVGDTLTQDSWKDVGAVRQRLRGKDVKTAVNAS